MARKLTQFFLGVFLVGCSQPLYERSSIALLRGDPVGAERIEAYRKLEESSRLPPEDREPALLMLAIGIKEEPSEIVRTTIAEALGSYDHTEAIEALHLACRDDSEFVRSAACGSLGRRRDRATVGILIRLATEDLSRDVRLAAVEALAEIPGDEARQGLVRALKDRDIAVVQAAGAGLRAGTGVMLSDDAKAWATHFETRRGADGSSVEEIATQPSVSLPPILR